MSDALKTIPQPSALPLGEKAHLARVLARAAALREKNAEHLPPVHVEIARRLHARLQAVKRPLSHILNASNDSGALQALLQQSFPASQLHEVAPLAEVTGLAPDSLTAAVSNLRLQLVDDVPLELFKLRQALKPDGLLLATTLGANSFGQLRSAFASAGLGETAHVIPLTDIASAGALLQRLKFALPVVDRDLMTLTFDTFEALLAALTRHAARNLAPGRARGLTTPRQLARVKQIYQNDFRRADGKLPLTLEVLYLHGWKPAASQPQAQARGSARTSLVRILGQHNND